MLGKRKHGFLRAQVPDLGGLVPAAGQQMLAVRSKRYAKDPVGVIFDRLFKLGIGDAAADVPDVHDAIAAAGCQPLAVRAGRQAEDRVIGVEKLLHHDVLVINAVQHRDAVLHAALASLEVVNANVSFLAGPSAGNRQLAVGQKDDGPHRLGAFGRPQFVAGGDLPHGHRGDLGDSRRVPAGDEAFSIGRKTEAFTYAAEIGQFALQAE